MLKIKLIAIFLMLSLSLPSFAAKHSNIKPRLISMLKSLDDDGSHRAYCSEILPLHVYAAVDGKHHSKDYIVGSLVAASSLNPIHLIGGGIASIVKGVHYSKAKAKEQSLLSIWNLFSKLLEFDKPIDSERRADVASEIKTLMQPDLKKLNLESLSEEELEQFISSVAITVKTSDVSGHYCNLNNELRDFMEYKDIMLEIYTFALQALDKDSAIPTLTDIQYPILTEDQKNLIRYKSQSLWFKTQSDILSQQIDSERD